MRAGPLTTLKYMLAKDRHGLLWSLIFALVAFNVYVVTLSRGVFPGPSSGLTVFAAGLAPDLLVAHPLWATLVRWIAKWSVLFSLPLRLNLFNAICASLSVGLFGQWMFTRIRDTFDASPNADAPPQTETIADHPRILFLAAVGGFTTALAFAFCVPFWSLSNALNIQPFELLLVLTAIHLTRYHRIIPSPIQAAATGLVYGIGCVESATLAVLVPILWFVLLYNRVREQKPWLRHMLFASAMTAAGCLLGVWLMAHMRSISLFDHTNLPILRGMIKALLHEHYFQIRHALPHTNWIWVLLLAFAPALTALIVMRKALRRRPSLGLLILNLAWTIAVVLCLLNTPVSPWGMLRAGGIFPVLPYAAVAFSAGFLAVYWLCVGLSHHIHFAALLSAQQGKQTQAVKTSDPASHLVIRILSYALSIGLAICVLLAPLRNRLESDGRCGAFMDQYAKLVLDSMGSRTWLATDGFIDNHLRILAGVRHKPLHLICLHREYDPAYLDELRDAIDQDPALAGYRIRLKNAASLSAPAFLQEWLALDPHALDHLAVYEFADFWSESGLTAKPDLTLFSGVHAIEPADLPALIKAHISFWDQIEPMIQDRPAEPAVGIIFACRQNLRRHTSLIGNQLGLLCQEMGHPEEALTVYSRVIQLDPDNVSAQLNRYALTLKGVDPKQKEEAALAAQRAIAHLTGGQNLNQLTRLYGSILTPKILAGAGASWIIRGQPAQTELSLRRAAEASGTSSNRLEYLQSLANLLILQNKEDQAETACKEILLNDPNRPRAILDMIRIKLLQSKPAEAQSWLNLLPEAVSNTPDVVLQKANIQCALKQFSQASKTLTLALSNNPNMPAGWLLLISTLIANDKLDEAELVTLPQMRQALQSAPGSQYLLYAAAGLVAQAKGPSQFREARNDFAMAAAMHPENMDFLEKTMALDMQLGDFQAAEEHAQRALRMNRQNAMGNYILGSILLAHGKLENAADMLQHSLEVKTTPMALNDYAECLRRMGKLPDAEHAAKQAVDLNPSLAAAWDTLANILLDAKRFGEALESSKRAIALTPSNTYVQITHARCLASQGYKQEAHKTLMPLLKQTSDLPSALCDQIQSLDKTLGAH